MKIKFMTYNIRSGEDMSGDPDIRHAVRTIQQEKPDILGLNEVLHVDELRLDGKLPTQAIASALGYKYYKFGYCIDESGGEFGNALISRFPIIESEIVPVPDIPVEERNRHFEHRAIIRCTLDLGGGVTVRTLNTHYGLSEGEIRSAVNQTTKLADEETLPMVFMGDLNALPEDELMKPLYSALTDTSSAVEGSQFTFPADNPFKKIDYIFHNGKFKTVRAWIPQSLDSDHLPYCAELEL